MNKAAWNFTSLTGQTFGKWTVLHLNEQRKKSGRIYWWCRCICGRESAIQTADLKSGKSVQCRWCADHHLKPGQSILHRILWDYTHNATKRGLCWELTNEQFTELIIRPCYYCGRAPHRITQKSAYGALTCNGLDRRDNGTGYTVENVVPCCPRCNRAKGPMAENEFWEWVQDIYKHTSQKVSHE